MTHEEKLEKRRETYRKNKEKILAQNKKWREDNNYSYVPDKAKKARNDKRYYDKNKEKVLAQVKKYNSENRDRRAEYIKEYAKTDKGKLVSLTTRQKRRGQILSTEDGSVTTESLLELLKTQDNKCHHCGDELDHSTSRAVHLDHLIPLSKGGQHTLSNVRWSCAYCNLTKNDKL